MLQTSGMGRSTGGAAASQGMGMENGIPYYDVQHASFPQHPADDPDTRFFIIRSSTDYNVEVSMQRGVWATIPRNETRLAQAVQEAKYVILFLRVQSSQCWSGYALMRNAPGQGSCASSVFAGRSGRPFVGRTFDVEWIRKVPLNVDKTRNLLNRFNNGESVNRAMDGQPVDPEAGRALAYMFDEAAFVSGASGPPISSYGARNAGPLGSPQGQPLPSRPPVQLQQTVRQRTAQQQQRQRHQDATALQHAQQQPLQASALQRKKQAVGMQFNSEEGSTAYHVGAETLQTKAPNNPSMRIFPVDLTGMTYEDYIEAYEASQALWQRVFKKHGYTVEDVDQAEVSDEEKAYDEAANNAESPPPLQGESANNPTQDKHSKMEQCQPDEPSQLEASHDAAGAIHVDNPALQEQAGDDRDDFVPTEREQENFQVVIKQELET